MLGRAHGVHDVVEARALVHQRERLLDERLEQLGAFGERLAHTVGADDRQAVAGQQHLGLERGHLAERGGPVARVALHLLRVAAVRRRPDEQVAGEQDLARPATHTQVRVVGLAAVVVQLERLAADLDVERVAVGLVGIAVLDRPAQPRRLELPLVDHRVVARGQPVAVEARGDRLVRDDARRRPAVGARLLLVEVDAEDVVDVAVREDRGVEPARRPRRGSSRARDLAWNTPLVSTTTRPSSVSTAAELANASTNATPRLDLGQLARSTRTGGATRSAARPVNSRSASSSRSMASACVAVWHRGACRREIETCFNSAVTTAGRARTGGALAAQPGRAPAPRCSTRRSQLAADGGFDAVQMRDVAAAADVALGTVYRYFSSKERLLLEAMAEQQADLRAYLETHPPPEPTRGRPGRRGAARARTGRCGAIPT